jgi:hypothetical protein
VCTPVRRRAPLTGCHDSAPAPRPCAPPPPPPGPQPARPARAQVIPVIGVWLGYFPLEFGRMFALAFSIYFPATHLLLYYCHDVSHMRSIFFSVTAGNMFWFAYAKARGPARAWPVT